MLYLVAGGKPALVKKYVSPVLRRACVKKEDVKGVELHGNTLPDLSPDSVAILFGAKGVEALQRAGAVPKNRSLGSLRGSPVKYHGTTWFVTYSPMLAERDPAKIAALTWDIQLAVRYHQTGTTKPDLGDYRYVDDFSDIIAKIEDKYAHTGKAVDVATDLETIGLDPYDKEGPLGTGVWIESIAFCAEEGTGDVVRFRGPNTQPSREASKKAQRDLWKQIDWLLNSPKVSIKGANFKYDMGWMVHHWGIQCTNFKFDTTLVGSLLDENRSNSLNMHAKIYTSMGGYDDYFNKKYDKSRMDLVPDDDFLMYAAGDVDACLRVFNQMKGELMEDAALTRCYVKLLHQSSSTFLDLEREGVLIDMDYQNKLHDQLVEERRSLEQEMLDMMPVKFRLKHIENLSIRAALLEDYYFGSRGLKLQPKMLTAKTKKPSTAMAHFEMFDTHPKAAAFTKKLKAYNSAGKTLQTYVVGFNKHLRSDGRFHSSYMLHKGEYLSTGKGGSDAAGTDTGRTSAKDPAVQTIPKHTMWAKPLRKAYIAPPGMVILSCDYAAGELRVAAVLANETRMLHAFNNGIDIHSQTAAGLLGVELEEFMLLRDGTPEQVAFFKESRQGAKAGNFGLLYGMSAKGYQAYAASSYGLEMTIREAEDNRDAFFSMYPALPEWHNNYINSARMHGYIRSPLGRVAHLPLINSRDGEIRSKQERKAINSPVQGTLSDMTQLSLQMLKKEYAAAWGKELRPNMMVHDDLKFYVPEKNAEAWAERVCYTMSHLPLEEMFGWTPTLTFEADAEVGYNLAEMEEL